MQSLSDALSHGYRGTLDKKITAHFIGRVSIGNPEDFMMAPGAKVVVVTLESVDDIQIHEIR